MEARSLDLREAEAQNEKLPKHDSCAGSDTALLVVDRSSLIE